MSEMEMWRRAKIAYLERMRATGEPEEADEADEAAWRYALRAALDPHDSKLQDVILRAMGFYSEGGEFGPMARVQAHDAIAALRAAAAQGGSVE